MLTDDTQEKEKLCLHHFQNMETSGVSIVVVKHIQEEVLIRTSIPFWYLTKDRNEVISWVMLSPIYHNTNKQ